MKLDSALPIAALRLYVRCFQQREAHIAAPVIYPIAARPEQILEFYLQERYAVRVCDSGAQALAPRAVVVGPSTSRRFDLVLRGSFRVFTIHFQPSGLHRLLRLPMTELADQAYDARSVIGPAIADLEGKLAASSSFDERVRAATNYLMRYLAEEPGLDVVAAIANRLLAMEGAVRVDAAAACAGLSVRQFERRFAVMVGLPPKHYARIIRFNRALAAKRREPAQRWTDIAQDFGYYDQMHLVKDFERFAGESPSRFIRRFEAMAEPWA